MATTETANDRVAPALWIVFFLSGMAALIYEVLWLRELGQVFGVATHAAATTLAAFFLGLAAGGAAWGRRAERLQSPLRTFAWLEIGVAASAILFFGLRDVFGWLYPHLFAFADGSLPILLGGKIALSLLILFPPAFFMGGTLPVMGQHLVRNAGQLGSRITLLYLVNTCGAAAGALLAGFALPPLLGFRFSYLIAIGVNLSVAKVALGLERKTSLAPPGSDEPSRSSSSVDANPPVPRALILTLAAVSGLLTLALEVLWTRMFAQVLHNSVYTFAIILVVFLVALALGSGLANRLCRRAWASPSILAALLVSGGVLVGLTPPAFVALTNGLRTWGGELAWGSYVTTVFALAATLILPTGIAIGAIFPYLLRASEPWMQSAGRTIGHLAAWNTAAGILGSLLAGFVLLEWLGLWSAFGLISVLYAAAAIPCTLVGPRPQLRSALAVAAAGILAITTLLADPIAVPLDDPAERIVSVKEGAHGTVAVIDRNGDLRLKVDNSYLLGTSDSAINLRLMSWIPLCLHPEPRSVFYLGLGTGITASGAMNLPVERVVATELNPDVIAADEAHFSPWLQGLFTDPRVEIVADDGRNHLFGSRETYDVIISDMFLTHRAGVGSLYASEHFRTVRSRLNPGGVFAQWLPMFELSTEEFGIITATMAEVFPEVTLWRRGFSPRFPVFALIGRTEAAPLDASGLLARVAALLPASGLTEDVWFFNIPLAAYVGNIRRSSIGSGARLNTDDRPIIEYLAPRIERDRHAGRIPSLSWRELLLKCLDIAESVPPSSDPFLAGVPTSLRRQVEAGLMQMGYAVESRLGNNEEALRFRRRYENLLLEPHPGE
jgi:spermidine synthase